MLSLRNISLLELFIFYCLFSNFFLTDTLFYVLSIFIIRAQMLVVDLLKIFNLLKGRNMEFIP